MTMTGPMTGIGFARTDWCSSCVLLSKKRRGRQAAMWNEGRRDVTF